MFREKKGDIKNKFVSFASNNTHSLKLQETVYSPLLLTNWARLSLLALFIKGDVLHRKINTNSFSSRRMFFVTHKQSGEKVHSEST